MTRDMELARHCWVLGLCARLLHLVAGVTGWGIQFESIQREDECQK